MTSTGNIPDMCPCTCRCRRCVAGKLDTLHQPGSNSWRRCSRSLGGVKRHEPRTCPQLVHTSHILCRCSPLNTHWTPAQSSSGCCPTNQTLSLLRTLVEMLNNIICSYLNNNNPQLGIIGLCNWTVFWVVTSSYSLLWNWQSFDSMFITRMRYWSSYSLRTARVQ